nr:transcriptional repressor [uncultured Chryseobacterium sp.]
MKQIRNTSAKTEILNIINSSKTALSHSDIQKMTGDLCNRVTIYRVLDRLEKEGEVHKITNIDGVVNFAKCSESCNKASHMHNHLHFNCEICKSVICIENVIPTVELPKGFKANEYNFVVSGICPHCSK